MPNMQNLVHNRSNLRIEPGYDLGRRLSVQAILSWQRTYGGLRFPSDVEPYPERYTEFHRLFQDNYLQAGAGISSPLGEWEISAAFLRTVSGTNTHDVHVYSLTASRPFRFRRRH